MLLSRGLISQQQLDEALSAQRRIGGRLGTNLVELGFIDDGRLAACLSEQLDVPFVRPSALASVPGEVINLMPRNLAQKYRAVPFRSSGGELHVCMADPQNFERVDEMAFALNARVRPYVVTEVTLNYALERYYNIHRERRLAPGITGWPELQLGGATPAPSTGYTGSFQVPVVPPPRATSSGLPAVTDAGPDSQMLAQLSAVMTDEDVAEALFQYMTEVFEDVMVLAVSEQYLELEVAGNRHRKRPASPTDVFALTEGSVLSNLLAKPQVLHQARANDASLRKLCSHFGLPITNLTLVSLFAEARPRHVVIALGLDQNQLVARFGQLKVFLGKIAHALRIVALRQEILR
jgi:hypothetical protein